MGSPRSHPIFGSPWSLLKCHNAEVKTGGVGFTNLAVSSSTVVWSFTSYCLNPRTLSLLAGIGQHAVSQQGICYFPSCSRPCHPVVRRLSPGVLGISGIALLSTSWLACASPQLHLEWLLFPEKREGVLSLSVCQRVNIYQIAALHRTVQDHGGYRSGSDASLPLRCSSQEGLVKRCTEMTMDQGGTCQGQRLCQAVQRQQRLQEGRDGGA